MGVEDGAWYNKSSESRYRAESAPFFFNYFYRQLQAQQLQYNHAGAQGRDELLTRMGHSRLEVESWFPSGMLDWWLAIRPHDGPHDENSLETLLRHSTFSPRETGGYFIVPLAKVRNAQVHNHGGAIRDYALHLAVADQQGVVNSPEELVIKYGPQEWVELPVSETDCSVINFQGLRLIFIDNKPSIGD